MRKGEVIQLSGKLATVKASTRKARTALVEAKRKLVEKFDGLDKLSEDEIYLKLGELYRMVAGHILDFPQGLPDVEWFASDEFEDKELKELEKDFLSV